MAKALEAASHTVKGGALTSTSIRTALSRGKPRGAHAPELLRLICDNAAQIFLAI